MIMARRQVVRVSVGIPLIQAWLRCQLSGPTIEGMPGGDLCELQTRKPRTVPSCRPSPPSKYYSSAVGSTEDSANSDFINFFLLLALYVVLELLPLTCITCKAGVKKKKKKKKKKRHGHDSRLCSAYGFPFQSKDQLHHRHRHDSIKRSLSMLRVPILPIPPQAIHLSIPVPRLVCRSYACL
ncbi:hypothetical protein M426DRAFT_125833 [Hypoxylon sp. CI-4A]|nr:hypothetical protein M426DRAFT_125833 [Hypoxylon sp. CI-4A]